MEPRRRDGEREREREMMLKTVELERLFVLFQCSQAKTKLIFLIKLKHSGRAKHVISQNSCAFVVVSYGLFCSPKQDTCMFMLQRGVFGHDRGFGLLRGSCGGGWGRA